MSQDVTTNRPRLLVIEDHHETQAFFSMALEDDYDVDTATNAQRAWELADQNEYDLLLVDIALRDQINGVELVAKLRQWPAYKTVPMIATTAHQHHEEEQFYLDHGFDAYLAKPFYPEMLFELIASLIKAAKSDDKGRPTPPPAG